VLHIKLASQAILLALPTKSCVLRFDSNVGRPLAQGATGTPTRTTTSSSLSSSSDASLSDSLGGSPDEQAIADAISFLKLTNSPSTLMSSGKRELVQRTAYCSWCFKQTTHTRVCLSVNQSLTHLLNDSIDTMQQWL
jgi:hypothetical protein